MANRNSTQTAAVIRYLLVLNELDRNDAGARSIDVAERLYISKPSVHTMIKTLVKKNFVIKEKYEAVHLTEEGRLLAEQYAVCFELLYRKMISSLKLPAEDCRKAACAVLSETAADELPVLAERLMLDPCSTCAHIRKKDEHEKTNTYN